VILRKKKLATILNVPVSNFFSGSARKQKQRDQEPASEYAREFLAKRGSYSSKTHGCAAESLI
jgi:hypothetical protein